MKNWIKSFLSKHEWIYSTVAGLGLIFSALIISYFGGVCGACCSLVALGMFP